MLEDGGGQRTSNRSLDPYLTVLEVDAGPWVSKELLYACSTGMECGGGAQMSDTFVGMHLALLEGGEGQGTSNGLI